jgi:hypothetical protein
MAQRFRWPKIDEEVNANHAMFQEFQNRKGRLGTFHEEDAIRTAAYGVTVLFGLVYLFLLIIRVLVAFKLLNIQS